ncbi:helix-turn-helix domain-containing protein [Pseudoroseomonas wenyumeiae]
MHPLPNFLEPVFFPFWAGYSQRVRHNPFHSTLGAELRSARRAAALTQEGLAKRAGVSLPTLRQAERGRGTLGTFANLAAELGMEIGGRFLPPGDTLGARLAALRRRRGMGQRS